MEKEDLFNIEFRFKKFSPFSLNKEKEVQNRVYMVLDELGDDVRYEAEGLFCVSCQGYIMFHNNDFKKVIDAHQKGIITEEEESVPDVLSGDPSRPYCKGRAYDPNRYASGNREE